MIRSLRGKVIEKDTSWLVLDVGGVGYQVSVSPTVLSGVSGEGETFLHIHDHIREDSHDLFGFTSVSDLTFFDQLLGISGVGPKVAMTILSIGSSDTLRRAIMAGDLETLTSVPGVGKKTAQKIILELKGQLVESEEAGTEDKEVVEALQSLGYPAQRAREALKGVPQELKDPSERIRLALRFLSK